MSTYSLAVAPTGPLTPLATIKNQRGAPPFPADFLDWLRKTTGRFAAEQRDLDWRKHEKSVINIKFYRGEQWGRVSRFDGTYRTLSRYLNQGDPRYTHNWVRGHSDSVTAQWCLARTELQCLALPDGDATQVDEEASRIGKAILDHYQRTLLTEEFRQNEGKLGQMTGDMFRFTWWDYKSGTSAARRPVYGTEQVGGTSVNTCADCGDTSVDDGSGACPGCGSPNVVPTYEEPGAEVPIISGYDSVPIGDIRTVEVPSWQIKYDGVPPHFSDISWLRWRCRMRAEVLRELFDWRPAGHMASGDDIGSDHSQGLDDANLRADRALSRVVGNTFQRPGSSISSTADEPHTVIVDRWWLKPCIYQDYVFPADLEFANGEIIPAGTSPIEIWPNGVYLLQADRDFLDFRNEDLHDHWQHTPLTLVPGQSGGDSLLEDSIEPQREINDIKGLKLSNIKHVAGAGVLYRPEWLAREEIPGKPYIASPVKPGTPPNLPLEQIAQVMDRKPLPAEVYEYEAEQQRELQWIFRSFSSSVGAPDIAQQGGLNTATGAALMNQSARSQRAPELALRAQGDSEWGLQVLRLFQKNATDEMYVPFQGKTGAMGGRWFKGADLPRRFVVTHRARSYIPKNEDGRRQDVMQILQACGGPEGLLLLAQAAPKLVEEIGERFDVNLDIGEAELSGRKGRLRIETMRSLTEQAGAQAEALGDPLMAVEMLVQAAPIDPVLDSHAELLTFYQNWANIDEGIQAREMEPLLYAAVHQQVELHKIAMVQQQQEASMMQVAMAGPQMAAEAEMAQAEGEAKGDGDKDDKGKGGSSNKPSAPDTGSGGPRAGVLGQARQQMASDQAIGNP